MTSCLSQSELRAFGAGLMDEQISDRIAEHLESCNACSELLATFDDYKDDFIQSIRAVTIDDWAQYFDQKEIQELQILSERLIISAQYISQRSEVPDTRFRIINLIGQGSLGEVYSAEDTQLNRAVALKKMKKRHTNQELSRMRFDREAEITGQLEHPGIVPVYARGIDAEGRPFYVMRLISGKTMQATAASFYSNPTNQSMRYGRSLEFGELIAQFISVCKTVDFAHRNNILHRDIKPTNIMIGAYGEALVVDWGLTRFSSITDVELSYNHNNNARQITHFFDEIPCGTLAYMCPERVNGEESLVGPASDIYSLGCTLYYVITGHHAFPDKDTPAIIDRVASHSFKRPRELVKEIPPALEAICLKAMSRLPNERYLSCKALADDLGRWVAGEPVEAFPETRKLRMQRWMKNHPKYLATVITASILLVASIVLFGWVWMSRRQKTDLVAMARMEQAEVIARDARSSGNISRWDEAIYEVARARDSIEVGSGSQGLRIKCKLALETYMQAKDRRRLDIETVAKLEEARIGDVELKGNELNKEAPNEVFLAAFLSYGINILDGDVDLIASRIRSSPISEDLLAALDDWVTKSPKVPYASILRAIIQKIETNQTRSDIRDAIARQDVAFLRRVVASKEQREKLGPHGRMVFNALLKLDTPKSFTLLDVACRERPTDFWIIHDLGLAYLNGNPRRPDDAVRWLSVGVSLKPSNSAMTTQLGLALYRKGNVSEAVAAYRRAINLDNQYYMPRVSLALALSSSNNINNWIEAEKECHRVIQLKPDFYGTYHILGSLLQKKGDFDNALKAFEQAISRAPLSAELHNNMGTVYDQKGDKVAAESCFRKAIELNPDYAEAYCNVGHALEGQGRYGEAFEYFTKGHGLGIKRSDWKFPSAQWIQDCQGSIALEKRLPSLLNGETSPKDIDERLAVADMCLKKLFYVTAVRFFEEAFKERPTLANDLNHGLRYNAACSAALAASGKGKDIPIPGTEAQANLRQLSLTWLRAELAGWSSKLQDNPFTKREIFTAISHWLEDRDLAGIRDARFLETL